MNYRVRLLAYRLCLVPADVQDLKEKMGLFLLPTGRSISYFIPLHRIAPDGHEDGRIFVSNLSAPRYPERVSLDLSLLYVRAIAVGLQAVVQEHLCCFGHAASISMR